MQHAFHHNQRHGQITSLSDFSFWARSGQIVRRTHCVLLSPLDTRVSRKRRLFTEYHTAFCVEYDILKVLYTKTRRPFILRRTTRSIKFKYKTYTSIHNKNIPTFLANIISNVKIKLYITFLINVFIKSQPNWGQYIKQRNHNKHNR